MMTIECINMILLCVSSSTRVSFSQQFMHSRSEDSRLLRNEDSIGDTKVQAEQHTALEITVPVRVLMTTRLGIPRTFISLASLCM